MLSVAEAQELILQYVRPLPPEATCLTPSSLGLVLAENVISDLDSPPFDKALMDGYAVRATDLKEGHATLEVVEEVPAGHAPERSIASGRTIRIMTGAPIPGGADAVVKVELSKEVEANRVVLKDQPRPGQNILPRGQEMTRGEVVVRAGCRLRPQEFGVLAAVGRTSVLVHPAPAVAILCTGDEIVEPHIVPGPAQIRNSNGPMLLAQVCRAGGIPRFLGIARDQEEHLRSRITEGLQSHVLILSGGVSAGKRDLVPATLAQLGVQAIFHTVEMKPGKPMFFGVAAANTAYCVRGSANKDGYGTLVFGLPGNPVSSLVCFELFVRPAIGRLLGRDEPGPCIVKAVLEEDFPYRSDRPTYHPARLGAGETGGRTFWRVRPVAWSGSADLRGLLPANAFVLFPPGDQVHKAGQAFAVLKVE